MPQPPLRRDLPSAHPHAAEMDSAGSTLERDSLDRHAGSLLLAAPVLD
jgi:hypothetical protein